MIYDINEKNTDDIQDFIEIDANMITTASMISEIYYGTTNITTFDFGPLYWYNFESK